MSTSTKMLCTIEIETLAASGSNYVRQCDQEAAWIVSSNVGGKYGPPAYRCWDHVDGTIEFLMRESSTEGVLVVRV
jgi:hypothetical protein